MSTSAKSSEHASLAGPKGKAQAQPEAALAPLQESNLHAERKAWSAPGEESSRRQRRNSSVATEPQHALGNQAMLKGLESETGIAALHHLFPLRPILGNQGTVRRLQTKLRVNTPGDQHEQEADRVAEQVMRMPAPSATAAPAVRSAVTSTAVSGVQRKCTCGGTCSKCQAEQPDHDHEHLQMKSSGVVSSGQVAAPPIVHEVLRSPGRSLDAETRAFMEPRFGHDFSQVRVHVDAGASESAAALGASAYTLGQHVIFGKGAFDSASKTGRKLIAHELAHTIQQRGLGSEAMGRAPGREREADRAASQVLAGGAVPTLTPSGVAVARQSLENMPPSVEWVDGQIALVNQQLQMPVLPPQLRASLLVRLHQLQLRRTQLATGGASGGSPAKQPDPKAQAEEDKQERRQRTMKRFAKFSDDELKQKIQQNCGYYAEDPTWRKQYDVETLAQLVEERFPNAPWWRDCRERLSAPTWTWYQRGELDKLKKDTSDWKPEQQGLARDLLWQWFELRKPYGPKVSKEISKEIKENLMKLFLAYYGRQLHEIDRQRMERCQGPDKPGWFETVHGRGGGADPCESWFKYPSSHGYNALTELQRSMRLAADDDDVVPGVAVWSWVQAYRMQTDPDLLAQAAIVEGVLGAVTMFATPGGEPMGRVNVPPRATSQPSGGLTEPPIQPPRPAEPNKPVVSTRDTVADFVKRGGVIKQGPKTPTPAPKVTAAPKQQAPPPEGYGDVYEQTGTSTRTTAGGGKEKVATQIGKWTDKNAEILQNNPDVLKRLAKETGTNKVFNKKLPNPDELTPEYKIEHPDYPNKPRIDRLWRRGKTVIEIKPNTKSAERGAPQAQQYAQWLDKYEPLPNGEKWKWEVYEYDQAVMERFLRGIGVLPPEPPPPSKPSSPKPPRK